MPWADEGAFTEAIAKRDRLLASLRRRFRVPVEDLEDAVQEATLRLWEAGPLQYPAAWLELTAIHLVVDQTRWRRRRQTWAPPAEAFMAQPGPDPAAAAEHHDLAQRLARALDQLAPRSAAALRLWAQDYRLREIADRTGIAPGSIVTTVARAKAKLRQAYLAAA